MPIYEYICDSCGCRFEALRNIGENSEVNCIKCATSARRIYSSVPFIFGGTRWVGESKAGTKIDLKDKAGSTKSKK